MLVSQISENSIEFHIDTTLRFCLGRHINFLAMCWGHFLDRLVLGNGAISPMFIEGLRRIREREYLNVWQRRIRASMRFSEDQDFVDSIMRDVGSVLCYVKEVELNRCAVGGKDQ